MDMNKKPFERPQVLKVVQVWLEEDLLQGPSSLSTVLIIGQEEDAFTITDEVWYD